MACKGAGVDEPVINAPRVDFENITFTKIQIKVGEKKIKTWRNKHTPQNK